MDPLTLSLLASLAPEAARAGTGLFQLFKGGQLGRQAQRPEYEIPQGIQDYLKIAKEQAQEYRLPGQSAIEERISGATSGGIRAAQEASQSPSALLATISALNANENKAYTDVGIEAATQQRQATQRLGQAQQVMGQFQDREFDINKMQPYLAAAKAAESLKGAGIQNIFGAASNIGGLGAQFLQQKSGQPQTGGSTSALGFVTQDQNTPGVPYAQQSMVSEASQLMTGDPLTDMGNKYPEIKTRIDYLRSIGKTNTEIESIIKTIFPNLT